MGKEKNVKDKMWVSFAIYGASMLVNSFLWFFRFDNIALGIINAILAVLAFVTAFAEKKKNSN